MPHPRPPTEPAAASPPDAAERGSRRLPEAERRRRRRELWISAGIAIALAALLLLQPIAGLTQALAASRLFLFLNAVVVILILLLGFLVTRNFWKLVGERRRGTLGSHLNLKFVSAFVLIAFVTASLLFAISAVIVTQSIDRWFSVQVDAALETSGRLAQRYEEDADAAGIRDTLAQYRALRPSAGNIRTAYLLELLLGFLVILMLATWIGFRMAKGVTGPIRALAKASAEVARGNLEVAVEPPADDEVGFLVRSFNRMTRDLRDARARLEHSNAELDQRRSSMEVVLGTIAAGVLSLDAEGRITTLNPSARHQLGIPPDANPIGGCFLDHVRQPQLRDLIVELGGRLRPGARESVRRQLQVPLGEDLATLLVSVTLLHDEAGGVLGRVVVLDDYTQPVKLQRMLAWREVASRIAHEIKNPLTPIQLSAQRLRRRFRQRFETTPDDVKVFDECVEAITSQVDGLKLLVDEFSNFARLPTANPQAGDLNRLIADAVASYDGTERVAFDAQLDPSLPTVDIDREQIRRALTNLIDNAIAAVQRSPRGGQGGRVMVRSAWDASLQSVRFEVADDGVGIPAADRRRIFEPYFSTRSNGTGLGLAIVSRIVADHHGYIRVQDNEPFGTRFIVELPARSA